MSIVNRVSNLFRAKVNKSLDSLENPIELLDQKLRDMEEALNSAKLTSAKVISNVYELDKKLELSKKEALDYDSKVRLALEKGNEDLAKKALAKKLELDKKNKQLEESCIEARTKAEEIKENLRELEKEIESTRSYRDEAAARFSSAEASKKVNEILSEVQTDYNRINLREIEQKIKRKEAEAAGFKELAKSDPIEDEFASLSEVDLNEELKKYTP